MNVDELKPVVEALLMVSEAPIPTDRLSKLLADDSRRPLARELVSDTLSALQADYDGRGVELAEVASGWRFRARADYASEVGRLWEERRPRYSRAFLETLAIIAYRQPITRGEIEHIRGVAVSSNIMRQLLEREWVKVVGHRDVPGRPAVYATTPGFLDYFGLKTLEALPTLAEIRDIDDINADLFEQAASEDAATNASNAVDGSATPDESGAATVEASEQDDASGAAPVEALAEAAPEIETGSPAGSEEAADSDQAAESEASIESASGAA